ncbi:hypothetical protein [Paraburkholderia sp.]|uniref:hypothetical protein n=1 Tax=Paraburkholderia sp. TaxID=1926495 RepID=UPI00286F3448|nr:hypothetical protein [Paraburkholderia sp.]
MSHNDLQPQLTTVVNYRPDEPDWSLGEEARHRYIGKNCLYDLAAVKASFQLDDVLLVTKDCKHDVTVRLQSEIADVWAAIQGLTDKQYRNSQWCRTSGKSWVPCDAYRVITWPVEVDGAPMSDVYVKFGMSKAGKCLLIVSCHPSGDEYEDV